MGYLLVIIITAIVFLIGVLGFLLYEELTDWD